jgi:membrane protease YdiL (CAAX protease family)
MTLLVKDDLKSLFIAKGKLKQGLIFGVISFLVMAAISLVPMLNSGNLFSFLLPSIHWILLFVFANAILEELWFRAIFLKKFEGLIGRNGAILVTSIVFGASHISATYDFPGGGLIFGIVVFGLGWLWAYLMFKYESLIVSILFHAGCDLLIIVPLLNSTEQMV